MCWRRRRTCDLRRVLFCMLEAAEGGLCLLEMLDVLDVPVVPEGMRRVLFSMLDAVEGEICLLEVLELMRLVLVWIP